MMVFLVSRERYRSALQLCSQAQNLIRHIRCQNIKMNRDCSVRWNFQNMDGIDFVDYSTKCRPKKRFNPQNLTLKVELYGFSPRENHSEHDSKTLSDYSFLSFSSPSRHLQLTAILAVSFYAEHGKALMNRERSKRLMALPI